MEERPNMCSYIACVIKQLCTQISSFFRSVNSAMCPRTGQGTRISVESGYVDRVKETVWTTELLVPGPGWGRVVTAVSVTVHIIVFQTMNLLIVNQSIIDMCASFFTLLKGRVPPHLPLKPQGTFFFYCCCFFCCSSLSSLRTSSRCWRLLSRWMVRVCLLAALVTSSFVVSGWGDFHCGISSILQPTAFCWRLWIATPLSFITSGTTIMWEVYIIDCRDIIWTASNDPVALWKNGWADRGRIRNGYRKHTGLDGRYPTPKAKGKGSVKNVATCAGQ